MRHARGVSVIEMMIVVALVAIIGGLALPSFTGALSGSRVRGAAESIQNGLQLARQEAVRRNGEVSFQVPTGGDQLWRVVHVTSGTVIQARSRGEGAARSAPVTVTADASTITFNGLGRVKNATADTMRIDVCDSACATGTTRVEVSRSGGVRMCNPSSASGASTGCAS
jgi:type IV fimbrial biogenesis protein FimT